MALTRYLAIIVLLLSLSCVKYSFKGALPSYLKTIYISEFENQTEYVGVRSELTRKVTESFIQDNSLTLAGSEKNADLILSGSIISIQRQAVAFNQQENVQQYKMVVTVKAECMNTHTQKPLWSGNLSQDGYIGENPTATDIDNAINEAIDLITEDIINRTIAAW